MFRLLFFIEPHHTTKAVAQALTTHAGPGDLIVHEGSLEYSGGLPFYTGRRIHVLNGKRGDLDFGSRYPEGRELFLDNSLVMDRWRGQRRIFLITRPGLHPTILRYLPEERVFFVGRYGSRGLYTNQQIK